MNISKSKNWQALIFALIAAVLISCGDGSSSSHTLKSEKTGKLDTLQIFEILRNSWNQDYSPGNCQDNISLLIANIEGVDESLLTGANVIYLYDKTKNLKPVSPRTKTSHWSYHVVLEKKGLIYDFDFTTKPVLIHAEPWLNKTFGGSKANSTIIVKSLPAEDYQTWTGLPSIPGIITGPITNMMDPRLKDYKETPVDLWLQSLD